MSILLAAILAALPNVMIGILARLCTEKFLQAVVERVIVFTLNTAVKLTTNTVDDELAAMVEARLKEKPE